MEIKLSTRLIVFSCLICGLCLCIVIFTAVSGFTVKPQVSQSPEQFTSQTVYGPACFSLLENLYFWQDAFYLYVRNTAEVLPTTIYGMWEGLDPRPFKIEVVNVPPWPWNAKILRLANTSIMFGDSFPKVWLGHYFHFVEIFSVLWSATVDIDGDPPRRLVLPDHDSVDGANWVGGESAANWHVLGALYPTAATNVLYQNDLALAGRSGVVKFDRVFVADRPSCFNESAVNRRLNTTPVSHCYLARRHTSSMVRTMYSTWNIRPDPPMPGIIRVTVVDRTITGTRVIPPQSQQHMLVSLNSTGRFIAQAVRFEELSFVEQVRIMSNTDVFIGVHGQGMTHTIWLPDTAIGVVELFPGGFHANSIHSLSALRNLPWRGIDGASVFRTWQPHRGDVNSPVQEVNAPLLVDLIGEMLQEAITTPPHLRNYCPEKILTRRKYI